MNSASGVTVIVQESIYLGCLVIEQERRNLGNYTRSWVLECSHDSGSEAGTNGIVSLHSMFNCSWLESILNNIPINAQYESYPFNNLTMKMGVTYELPHHDHLNGGNDSPVPERKG